MGRNQYKVCKNQTSPTSLVASSENSTRYLVVPGGHRSVPYIHQSSWMADGDSFLGKREITSTEYLDFKFTKYMPKLDQITSKTYSKMKG